MALRRRSVAWNQRLQNSLAKAFKPEEISYRPGATTQKKVNGKYPPGTKAQRLPYIDARDVEERLDDVVGPSHWQDTYSVVDAEQGAVQCSLGIQMPDGTWVWKNDVGYPNDGDESPEKERLKAAFSDALKRAAVKWGVGREIYSLPREWAEINEYGRFLK